MNPITTYIGDCRAVLPTLDDQSVQCCITSPPYFGLRNYNHSDQIGIEKTPDEYVANLVGIFTEVFRVLKDDGTLWLNLGDSFNSGSSGGLSGSTISGGQENQKNSNRNGRKILKSLKPKDLIGIPWMVAFALRSAGWYLRSDIIWCLSGGVRVYAKTQKGEIPMTIKDMVRLDPKTVKLWNGNKWTQVLGWNQGQRSNKTFEIELRSGERIGCTAGHKWPTQRGNIRADELKIGDVIETCRLPEPKIPAMPNALDDEDVGWFIGLYIAEGSQSDGTIQISSHSQQGERFDRLSRLVKSFHATCAVHKTSANGSTANLNGPILNGIIDTYISGRTAKDKHLHSRAWARSDGFLMAVINGYLHGDGHKTGDRWRIGFTKNDSLAADLRTICARLGLVISLRRCHHTMDGRRFPGYRGEIRFNRSGYGNEQPMGKVVAIRSSRARKFWDIGVADAPNLFALSSGVLTHNSKPNPMPESVRDRPTRAHEYIFLLTKRPKYYYNADAIKDKPSPDLLKQIAEGYNGSATKEFGVNGAQDASATKSRIIEGMHKRIDKQRGHSRRHDGFNDRWDNLTREEQMACGANKRDVWRVEPANFKGAHFATFPPELITPCVLAGTKERDTILDPFGGSGTVGQVAIENGRKAILIELNQEYQSLIEQRVQIGARATDV